MKIISWNINGYRAVTGQNSSKRQDTVTKENKLFALIEHEQPDIICLQETKADMEQIDEKLRLPYGYTGTYHSCSSKKGYSGVVTFSRVEPVSVKCKLGIDEIDCEGRIVETDLGDFVHLNIYFPKAYDDMTRMDFKLKFYDIIFNYTQNLRSQGRKVIISGDYNTAHHEIDLANPQRNIKTSGFMPIEREKIDRLAVNGYVDAFRLFTSEGGHYTWWSQRLGARDRNIGWRIDYHFITEDIIPFVKNAYHLPQVLGSDHCPVVIDLEF